VLQQVNGQELIYRHELEVVCKINRDGYYNAARMITMINRVNKFTNHSFMRGSRVVGLYRRLGDMGNHSELHNQHGMSVDWTTELDYWTD